MKRFRVSIPAGLILLLAGVIALAGLGIAQLALAADTTVSQFDIKNQVYQTLRLKDNTDGTFSYASWLTQGGNICKIDANGTLQTGELPPGTSITASSTGGAQANNCTLAGVSGKTTYITGFEVTGAGATSASNIAITVTGTISGTMNYTYTVPSGATTGGPILTIILPTPVAASAQNTAIVVNVPSFGTGNTAASVTAHGFQL